MRNRILLLVVLASLGFLLIPRREHWERHAGETMGTTFQVTWSSRARAGAADRIRAAIDATLEQVNAQMSTYRPDSEICRFALAPAGEWFPVSVETESVVREALSLAEATGGAFDPTVAPLVDLWGFGPAGRRSDPPDSTAIAAARARTGWRGIETRSAPPALRRESGGLSLDLSAIAKGHGVDRIAGLLEETGAGAYLVEIGGELRVLGDGPSGSGWRVELERPEAMGAAPGDPAGVDLRGGGVATSGTYRNLFDANGVRFHHVIDPRTGYPADHGAAQVTTFAETCQTADGRATALLVLGPEEGRRLAEDRGWAARFLVVTGSGAGAGWTEVVTSAFADLEPGGSGKVRPQ